MSVRIRKKSQQRAPLAEGKTAKRFRRANIAIFILALILMLSAMLVVFNGIVRDVSFDFAGHYAVSSANAFSAHIEKEIGLLSKAAHSGAVVEWLLDDANRDKKILAFNEMSKIVEELYSNNLYIGIDKTQQEFDVKADYTDEDLNPVAALFRGNPEDAWYYECIASDSDYLLNVDIDHLLQKKRLWLDYKVAEDGAALGVICTGLDFSQLIRELFTHSDSLHLRGLIIDNEGVVRMDSYLMGDGSFSQNDADLRIEGMFPDPVFLAAINSYLGQDRHFNDNIDDPVVIRLSSGRYRYVSVTPIRFTDWSAIILYDSSSLFSISRLIPAIAIILLILIALAFMTNIISTRFIFKPLEMLVRSLIRLKENNEEHIYGIERDDEFGNLSNTIIDLFAKANYDALTGIYNRRFMETNLQQIIEFLSRSNGTLSLLMVDVDFFKLFNDTYGHQEGDRCLKAIAQALDGSLTRSNDFVARYGGEEFVAVLPNTDETGARMIANKVLENVRLLNIPHAKSVAADIVTVSVGATTGEVNYQHGWAEYVKCADDALYASKQSGRNKCTFMKFTSENAG